MYIYISPTNIGQHNICTLLQLAYTLWTNEGNDNPASSQHRAWLESILDSPEGSYPGPRRARHVNRPSLLFLLFPTTVASTMFRTSWCHNARYGRWTELVLTPVFPFSGYTVPVDELGTVLPGDKKFAMGHRSVTAFLLFVACILRSAIGLADIGKSCARTGGVKGGPATGNHVYWIIAEIYSDNTWI